MVLNSDCVRDVLLAVEAAGYDEHISPRTLSKLLPQYTEQEIEYTCLILDDGNFLIATSVQLPGQELPCVNSIVRLIAKIRDSNRWHKIKNALPAVRNYSLSAISAVAEGITSAAINAYISGQT